MRPFYIIIAILLIFSCNQKSKTRIPIPLTIIKDTFDNGNVKTKYFYPDSSDKGNYVEITFYKSGYVSEEKSKLDTRFHGTYKVYWDKPNKVLYYETLNDHQTKVKYEKGYDSLGHLIRHDSLIKSCKAEPFKCDAFVTVFFSNGKPREKYQQVNGEKNGPYIEYYANGSLSQTGNYANGKENGILKFYDENGNYIKTLTVLNGKREGLADIIYENGVHGFGQYHNDREEGKWIMKDTSSGKTIDSLFFKNGQVVKFHKK
jgi:antitoxin component YwqK of YwqJK toxin-antitoxin module